jgi:2-polyprenyl-3-methyl-5-hydroxy-6-metoxy-1,4-benzoquinol methylase
MFETRDQKQELIDLPDCPKSLVRTSHKFMEYVNRFFGGTAVVRKFVKAESLRLNKRSLKILDIGSGSCDIALNVSRWCRRQGFEVKFTCVESSSLAVEMAREKIACADGAIELINADIFEYAPAETFDCAVGSMFFHHLTDGQMRKLIKHLKNFVKHSVLINDLHRCLFVYAGCCLLTSVLPADVRHDALLSVKRSFQPEQLRALLCEIDGSSVLVDTAFLGRVKAIIQFHKGE